MLLEQGTAADAGAGGKPAPRALVPKAIDADEEDQDDGAASSDDDDDDDVRSGSLGFGFGLE